MIVTYESIQAKRRADTIRALCGVCVAFLVIYLGIVGIVHDSNTAVATADAGTPTSISYAGNTTLISTDKGRVGIKGLVAYKTGQTLQLEKFPTGNVYLCTASNLCALAQNVMWPMEPTEATVIPLWLAITLIIVATMASIALLVNLGCEYGYL